MKILIKYSIHFRKEFYDAISQASGSNAMRRNSKPFKRSRLTKLSSITDSESSDEFNAIDRFGSIKSICSDSAATEKSITPSEADAKLKPNFSASSLIHKVATKESMISRTSRATAPMPISRETPCTIDTLILVVHGGNVTCTDTSKKSDFSNFKATMQSVIKGNYHGFESRIAYRLVACEPICKEALLRLTSCSPVASHEHGWRGDQQELAETSADAFALHENLPFSTIPLLVNANSAQYQENLLQFTRDCNRVYREFLVGNSKFVDF